MNQVSAQAFLDEIGEDATITDCSEIEAAVGSIYEEFKSKGGSDSTVLKLTKQFDGVDLNSFVMRIEPQTIKDAYSHVPQNVVEALKKAAQNIKTYHKFQIPQDWEKEDADGNVFGLRYTPIESVGLYVPGGRAAYPSTVLMNAIPAKLAGVKTIVMVTPPLSNGSVSAAVLVAADICGIDEIYKVGGAQAVFALAHGTESIPKVDKIVGPGNAYVNEAKKRVFGMVDIDKPAGPSEVIVLLDDSVYAPFAASELLAQLEHDPVASAICVSSSQVCLDAVKSEVESQMKLLKRQEILGQSITNCMLVLSGSLDESVDCINKVASEHLVLLRDDWRDIISKVKHAGSIFCGPYTPVTLGDYYAGPNHVLPTEGAARYASPLGVMDFMKYSSYLEYSKENLEKASRDLKILTEVEGFDAHYNAVSQRLT